MNERDDASEAAAGRRRPTPEDRELAEANRRPRDRDEVAPQRRRPTPEQLAEWRKRREEKNELPRDRNLFQWRREQADEKRLELLRKRREERERRQEEARRLWPARRLELIGELAPSTEGPAGPRPANWRKKRRRLMPASVRYSVRAQRAERAR